MDPAFLSKVIGKCTAYQAQAEVEKGKLGDLRAGYAEEGDAFMQDAVAAAKEEISRMVTEAVPPPPQQHVEQK